MTDESCCALRFLKYKRVSVERKEGPIDGELRYWDMLGIVIAQKFLTVDGVGEKIQLIFVPWARILTVKEKL